MRMLKSMPWDWHLVRDRIFCLTLDCFLVGVFYTQITFFKNNVHLQFNNMKSEH